MRVISGEYGGRSIRTIEGPSGYRPATSKVRGAVFSMLESAGADWPEVRILDVFAGSGSLGIEALSRGAPFVQFIEKDRGAAQALSGTLSDFRVERGRFALTVKDYAQVLSARPPAPFDVVFSDPPYGKGLLLPCVQALLDKGWIAEGGLLLAEVAERDPYPDAGAPLFDKHLEWIRNRLYGQTRICVWKVTATK